MTLPLCTEQLKKVNTKVRKKSILVFSATTEGGLADHIFYQTRMLNNLGYKIIFLAQPGYLAQKEIPFPVKYCLFRMPSSSLPLPLKRLLQVFALCANHFILAYFIIFSRPYLVLVDSYREYLAPLWSWSLNLSLKISKTICATNLHDPVRDFVVGPIWWHNLSIKCGYSFIKIALVHAKVPAEAAIPSNIYVVEVPVGIYDLPTSNKSPEIVRQEWKAKPCQHIFLSFGFIRDNKNIDLLIRALVDVKEAFLVVAGKAQSANDRPLAFYQSLSKQLNVDDRCFFFNGFLSETEIGNFFATADFVALTYSATFHSQSGVLNLAAASKLTVLGSGAQSPLTQSILKYNLGVVIKPDSTEEIIKGMNFLIQERPKANWAEYYNYAGWESNVNKLIEAAIFLKSEDASTENIYIQKS